MGPTWQREKADLPFQTTTGVTTIGLITTSAHAKRAALDLMR